MKKYICNPINFSYRYQWIRDIQKQKATLAREAADPSMVLFKGKYYVFPSMTKGFLVSDDLASWELHQIKDLPVYDYAPDVRVIGDYLYFCASKHGEACDFYRTKDPLAHEFEKIPGSFPFWDPNLFSDDDNRLYFYWGCSNIKPIYGVELDPITMKPIGDIKELITMKPNELGYERAGVDHQPTGEAGKTKRTILASLSEKTGMPIDQLPPIDKLIHFFPESHRELILGILNNNPFYEGAWMTKHNNKYYLQYASPGAEFNVYNDAYYVSDNPLGPFVLGKNNPFSYMPGGFISGAGHGSTMKDINGKFWHTSTMRISKNQHFERRIGLWKAGFDDDDELVCNTHYGDWPYDVFSNNLWEKPHWMLLSYKAHVQASSNAKDAMNIVDEDIRTVWQASSNQEGEWVVIDLGKKATINAIQVNFGDNFGEVDMPRELPDFLNDQREIRYIDDNIGVTRWKLEASLNGEDFVTIEDKWHTDTDLPHDLVVNEKGFEAQYIKLILKEVPYKAKFCVSGLRVFGHANIQKPNAVKQVIAKRITPLDLHVKFEGDATGYNVLWGHRPDKLYHSYLVYDKTEVTIGALVSDETYYVRVDAFNGAGITEGLITKVL